MTAATHWQCRDRKLDLGAPVVMGVLNVTPDSFSDGGRFVERDVALTHARRMIEEGAAIIDIGGESTRPGAASASLDEELERVVPVIEALRRESCAAGADIINDVRALREPDALLTAAGTRAGICLMHMKGEPRTMQAAPGYDDVVSEVSAFLAERVAACRAAGIERARLTVDPGFGFGKRIVDNLALLKNLGQLRELGVPLAVGLSRKSMLAKITGRDVDDRIAGSIALAAIAVLNGARIVRAHDVAATVDAIRGAAAVAQGESFDGT
jgi:dihydropteroate synthase